MNSTETSDDSDDLLDVLRNSGSPVCYVPNPGNAGDSLISVATHQFFRTNNVSYEMYDPGAGNLSGRTIVYAGGGNFGGNESRVADYLRRYAFSCERFILLPHTIFGADDLLERMPETVHIFCRERVSYEHAARCCKRAKVYLRDDMVINADIKSFLRVAPENSSIGREVAEEFLRRMAGRSEYDFGISLRSVANYYLHKIKQITRSDRGVEEGVLNAFRVDVEKTERELPSNNDDISALYELSSCDARLSAVSTYRLLKHISRYDVVNTNRLHVGIAAMKLGKRVNLYGNNYFKIRAIYDYSIKGRFANVEWCD